MDYVPKVYEKKQSTEEGRTQGLGLICQRRTLSPNYRCNPHPGNSTLIGESLVVVFQLFLAQSCYQVSVGIH